MIYASRKSIKLDLLAYGENELAARIDLLNDLELNEIGKKAANYLGKGYRLYSKIIAMGAIEFLEGRSRETKNKKRDMSVYKNDTGPDDENLVARMKL